MEARGCLEFVSPKGDCPPPGGDSPRRGLSVEIITRGSPVRGADVYGAVSPVTEVLLHVYGAF